MIYKCYTDGACSGNPGIGGYGCIIYAKDKYKILSGNKEYTTNNEMELMGVLVGLEYLFNRIDINKKYRIEIISDSAYVVDTINKKWYVYWQLNKWKTKGNTEVKNKDIWVKILELINNNVKFIKVKGHAGDKYNEMVDKIAKDEVLKIKNNMGD